MIESNPPKMADEEFEYTPPSPQRVAKRALVLASLACRGSLELAPNDPDAHVMHGDLQQWIPEIGIRDEFEPDEWDTVSCPLGSLSRQDVMNLGWNVEGLAVLAWALHRIALPRYDEEVDGPLVGGAVDVLSEDATSLIHNPNLRKTEELHWYADLTLAVHWRIRQYQLDGKRLDFDTIGRQVDWATFPMDDLRIKRNDLALRGKPIFKCSREVIDVCHSIAVERQRAANWLIGTESVYSQVTCDT